MTPLNQRKQDIREMLDIEAKRTPGEMLFLRTLKTIQSAQDDMKKMRPHILVHDRDIRNEDAAFIAMSANNFRKLAEEYLEALEVIERMTISEENQKRLHEVSEQALIGLILGVHIVANSFLAKLQDERGKG